ncbi:MAG: hypothetical protein INR73_03980 [Williamsia sp.]|nr:hypothetical protein [Williamsia sp.]
MNPFDIKLPGSVLADLFKTSLVASPAGSVREQQVEEKEIVPITYLGKNLHQITVGLYFSEHPNIPADNLQFLASILKACQRSIDHVAVINFAARELQLTDIADQLHPKLMLLFGAHHVFGSWMIETDDFVPFYLHKIQVVRVPGLEHMLHNTPESRALKGKLWMILKQLFNL